MPMDFYDVLGAPADASSEELKRAYRARVREYHPDVNDHPDGDEQFKLVRKAHDVLSDPAERKDYDRMGHREYVDKRLDDLPPVSVFPEAEEGDQSDSGSEATVDSTGSVGADRSSPQRGTGSSTEKHSTSASASSNRSTGSRSTSSSGSSGRSRSEPTQSSSSSRSTDTSRSTEHTQSTGSGQSTASTRSAGDERSTNSTRSGRSTGTTSAGAERSNSSWDDVTESVRTSTTRSSTTSAAARRRRGLRRWYGVVLLSLLTYFAGIGTYAAPHAGTLSGLATALTSTPVATLTATFPLPSPTTYVLGSATAAASGEPGVGLLFLVGAVALPVVVLTAVAQFGHGSAWIYAVASLGPIVPLAAAPFSLPTALALVGLVVLPLFSGLGFLIDVGRYLLDKR